MAGNGTLICPLHFRGLYYCVRTDTESVVLTRSAVAWPVPQVIEVFAGVRGCSCGSCGITTKRVAAKPKNRAYNRVRGQNSSDLCT